VKRLANSYGVLAPCRPNKPDGSRPELDPIPDAPSHDPGDSGAGSAQAIGPFLAYPYRAAMVLLAAVIGYPD
jgi:hypothetical protein